MVHYSPLFVWALGLLIAAQTALGTDLAALRSAADVVYTPDTTNSSDRWTGSSSPLVRVGDVYRAVMPSLWNPVTDEGGYFGHYVLTISLNDAGRLFFTVDLGDLGIFSADETQVFRDSINSLNDERGINTQGRKWFFIRPGPTSEIMVTIDREAMDFEEGAVPVPVPGDDGVEDEPQDVADDINVDDWQLPEPLERMRGWLDIEPSSNVDADLLTILAWGGLDGPVDMTVGTPDGLEFNVGTLLSTDDGSSWYEFLRRFRDQWLIWKAKIPANVYAFVRAALTLGICLPVLISGYDRALRMFGIASGIGAWYDAFVQDKLSEHEAEKR